MIYIGILNNYLHYITVAYRSKLVSEHEDEHFYEALSEKELYFAGLKLIFKGGRAAQIMLPEGSNLLSDDTDIFLQSTNIAHTPFFLKTFAVELAKSWIESPQIISRIGKVNPNIVKIAYKSSNGFIPISDIDFGSPTYPQYYDDIKLAPNPRKIVSKPLTNSISKIKLVYYHQSPESFFAEKQFIYDMYLNPIYKTCDCGVVPHTEECVASCSERQFYLDKFKKYVDLKTTPSLSNRKTQKKQSIS